MGTPHRSIDWLDLRAQMQAAALLEARIATRLRADTGLRTLDETTRDMVQLCDLRSRIQATLWRGLLQARVADARKGAVNALYNRAGDAASERGRHHGPVRESGAD